MIRTVGVDVCGVERMALAVRRSGAGFLKKTFTPAELAYCGGRSEKLAGRWAAKEAVIKCFTGTPIRYPRRSIEILPGPDGAPRVHLLESGSADARAQPKIAVSITHQAGIAIASASLALADVQEEPLPAPEAVMLPQRPPQAHKGSFGTVVGVAGSLGLTGAAFLSATSAARSGAGMVRLLVAESLYPILAVKCTEVMANRLPEGAPGAISHAAADSVLRQLNAAAAGYIGPGLGRDRSTWRMVYEVVGKAEVPLVIDADALNALAENRRLFAKLGPTRVLTPHPGELGRLLNLSTEQIQADRPAAVRQAAHRSGATVVLKGARTLVCRAEGPISEDPHEVPALATGGTGDVLTGLVAALLAQGCRPFEAAVTAVYVHAEAGRRVSGRLGESGLLASDLLGEIPLVMKVLRAGGH
ncbi:MAG: NAD(P)H-hydrate dehydratase [Candidatus Dormibacteraeota bacterium]|nr:NAD(P)H-hydrate dehydratase [Candidatus Dormibacteraeota bacterium]